VLGGIPLPKGPFLQQLIGTADGIVLEVVHVSLLIQCSTVENCSSVILIILFRWWNSFAAVHFQIPAPDRWLTDDHSEGKLSAVGQPT